MFLPSIGKEFKKQMEGWFKEHPEVEYKWNENQLKIIHPKEPKNYITFEFDSKFITIEFGRKKKVFKRQLFSNVEEQVFRIRGFWINYFLTEEDTKIPKPKLKKNQIVSMFCNSKYGQVLTTNKNIFTGWGSVYQVFETWKDARNFEKQESRDDEIEIHFYNCDYELLDIGK